MVKITSQEIEYQLAHIKDDRSQELVLSHTICISIALVAVILRVLSRYLGGVKFGPDDYMIVAAFMFGLGEVITCLICTHNGGGKHVILLVNPEAWTKPALATIILYNPAINGVKASCLLLYRRLFPNRKLRITIWIIGLVVFLNLWIVVFTAIFQCRPIRAAWDPSVKNAQCIKFNEVALGFAIVNSITDLVTCLLPVPMLWGLQLPKAKKISLIAIFMLGVFVCVVSVYRITIIHRLSLTDGPWTDVDPAIWSIVEVCVGILCACLPTLRPLTIKLRNSFKGSFSSGPFWRSYSSSSLLSWKGNRKRQHAEQGKEYYGFTGPSVATNNAASHRPATNSRPMSKYNTRPLDFSSSALSDTFTQHTSIPISDRENNNYAQSRHVEPPLNSTSVKISTEICINEETAVSLEPGPALRDTSRVTAKASHFYPHLPSSPRDSMELTKTNALPNAHVIERPAVAGLGTQKPRKGDRVYIEILR